LCPLVGSTHISTKWKCNVVNMGTFQLKHSKELEEIFPRN
jgi:hypothetical protein